MVGSIIDRSRLEEFKQPAWKEIGQEVGMGDWEGRRGGRQRGKRYGREPSW